MSQNRALIPASPPRVWSVLADGAAFKDWVVGCRRVRRIEGGWPDVGSKVHHQVGLGPLNLNDTTTVVESQPAQRLVLRARFRPAGIARVVIELEPEGDATAVTMEEEVVGGWGRRVPGLLVHALLAGRNTETLRRLSRLVLEDGKGD